MVSFVGRTLGAHSARGLPLHPEHFAIKKLRAVVKSFFRIPLGVGALLAEPRLAWLSLLPAFVTVCHPNGRRRLGLGVALVKRRNAPYQCPYTPKAVVQ